MMVGMAWYAIIVVILQMHAQRKTTIFKGIWRQLLWCVLLARCNRQNVLVNSCNQAISFGQEMSVDFERITYISAKIIQFRFTQSLFLFLPSVLDLIFFYIVFFCHQVLYIWNDFDTIMVTPVQFIFIWGLHANQISTFKCAKLVG